MTQPLDARAFAHCLRMLDAKLATPVAHVDISWMSALARRFPVLHDGSAAPLRAVLLRSYLLGRHRHAGAPRALAFSQAGLWLATRDCATIARLLCTLAIVRRPGVLRCCLEREARTALQAALGTLYQPLLQTCWNAQAVDARTAAFAPLHWIGVGYRDWLRCLEPGDAVCRRLVRAALPTVVGSVARTARTLGAERQAPDALAMLMALEQA